MTARPLPTEPARPLIDELTALIEDEERRDPQWHECTPANEGCEKCHVAARLLAERLASAFLRVGYCYPAACSDEEATELVHEHGYEFGPFQFIELGHRLAEAPSWPMFALLPDWARETKSEGA